MRLRWIVVLVVLGAALAGFAVATGAERLGSPSAPPRASVAASPQTARLHWHEVYGKTGERIVFAVERFRVLRDGWAARVSVANQTQVPFEVGDPRVALDRAFGLMLFANGTAAELERRNQSGTLPAIRPATGYTPSLPDILAPGGSWHGTISARGSLVAGGWVRVVFGTLVADGRTPDVIANKVVWITDHAYQLRP